MKKTVVFFLPFLTLLLCGCLATQGSLDGVNNQLNVLNSNINDLRKNQADLSAKMDTLSGDLMQNSDSNRDVGRRMSEMSAKIDDSNTMIARLLDKKSAVDNIMVPSTLYSEARTYLMQKNYEEAIKGFELYLEKYPDGEFAENAEYYMGDAYFGLKKWKEAAVSYAAILTKYKNSKFAASARLKYAQSILELEDKSKKKEAITYLKSVVQDYPGYPEARIAKEKLKELTASK